MLTLFRRMFPLSIKKLNPFKKFKQFKKFDTPKILWIFLSQKQLRLSLSNDLNELNHLNSLNGKRFGAGDGDRTRDVQLGNFLLKLAFSIFVATT
jgi:hypothetical protein